MRGEKNKYFVPWFLVINENLQSSFSKILFAYVTLVLHIGMYQPIIRVTLLELCLGLVVNKQDQRLIELEWALSTKVKSTQVMVRLRIFPIYSFLAEMKICIRKICKQTITWTDFSRKRYLLISVWLWNFKEGGSLKAIFLAKKTYCFENSHFF